MKLDAGKSNKLQTYWSKSSKKDFESAQEIVHNTKRYSSALFFMHLSVEKSLKALFVKKHSEPAPYSHNLLSIAAKCELKLTPAIEKTLLEINEFNLESRYPDEKFSLEKKATKRFALNQLSKTEEILKWIFST
jgi:HEPN domain-containing protein